MPPTASSRKRKTTSATSNEDNENNDNNAPPTTTTISKEERQLRALQAKEKAKAWKEKRALKKAGVTVTATAETPTAKTAASATTAKSSPGRKKKVSSSSSVSTSEAVSALASTTSIRKSRRSSTTGTTKATSKRTTSTKKQPIQQKDDDDKNSNKKEAAEKEEEEQQIQPKTKRARIEKDQETKTSTNVKAVVPPPSSVLVVPPIPPTQQQHQHSSPTRGNETFFSPLSATYNNPQQLMMMHQMYPTASPYTLAQMKQPPPQPPQYPNPVYYMNHNTSTPLSPYTLAQQPNMTTTLPVYPQQQQYQVQHVPAPVPVPIQQQHQTIQPQPKEASVPLSSMNQQVTIDQKETIIIENVQEEEEVEEEEQEQEETTIEKQPSSSTPTLFSSLVSKVYKIIKNMTLLTLIGFIIISLLSYLFTNNNTTTKMLPNTMTTPSNPNTNSHKNESTTMICFQNYGFEKQIIIPTTTDVVDEMGNPKKETIQISNKNGIANCSNLPKDTLYLVKPCPKYGKCVDGQLVDCTNYENHNNNNNMITENDDEENKDNDESKLSSSSSSLLLFIPSQNGKECILSSYGLEQMMKLHSTIVDLTIDYTCHGGKRFDYQSKVMKQEEGIKDENEEVKGGDGEDVIMFDIQSISTHLNMDISTIHYLIDTMKTTNPSSQLHIQTDINNTDMEWISLSSTFIHDDLPIPTSCWIKLLSWDIMTTITKHIFHFLSWMIIHILWNVMKTMIYSYPLPTLLISMIVLLLSWMKIRRNHIQSLRKDVASIQNLVYDRLMNGDKDGSASLHIRDDIMHELYSVSESSNMKKRQEFIKNVWPRVVVAVRMDNRVRKSVKNVRGKSLEWWEWVATATTDKMKNSSNSGKENVVNTWKSLKVD